MKKYLFSLSIFALILSVGCEKKEYAREAVYGKVTFSPANPYVGDTVTMTVEVLDPGHRIFHADYRWSCTSVFSDEVRVTAPDGAKTIVAPPTYEYVFKESGDFNVSMTARLKFSMPTEGGALFGSASSRITKITVKKRPSD